MQGVEVSMSLFLSCILSTDELVNEDWNNEHETKKYFFIKIFKKYKIIIVNYILKIYKKTLKYNENI